MMNKSVNITIVTHNRLEYTKQCIMGLKENTKIPYNLTIVDNGSTDGTRQWINNNVHEFDNIKLFDKNIGIARGYNWGWYHGTKKYFLKLDNDIIPKKRGWLAELIFAADRSDKIGVIGYSLETTAYPLKIVEGYPLQVKSGGQNVNGGCMLVPERTWETIGYFNEEYYDEKNEQCLGGVDSDYGYRNHIAGRLNCYLNYGPEEIFFNAGHHDIEENKNSNYYKEKRKARKKNTSPGGLWHKNITTYNSGNIYKDTMWAHEALDA